MPHEYNKVENQIKEIGVNSAIHVPYSVCLNKNYFRENEYILLTASCDNSQAKEACVLQIKLISYQQCILEKTLFEGERAKNKNVVKKETIEMAAPGAKTEGKQIYLQVPRFIRSTNTPSGELKGKDYLRNRTPYSVQA